VWPIGPLTIVITRILIFAVSFLCCTLAAHARSGLTVTRHSISLGATSVTINVYEKPGSDITFFAPHYNERIAIETAKAAIEQHGGRLVSIESVDEAGKPARRIRFVNDGGVYSIDPNRIFTSNGRRCSGMPAPVLIAVEQFASQLLALLRLDVPSSMIVAVHNNNDSSRKAGSKAGADLTASAFARLTGEAAEYHEQAAGVFLSNAEKDDDNFVFVSNAGLMRHFVSHGFNTVLQKPVEALADPRCSVDDGSLSVYSGQKNIDYICLEADATTGAARQTLMFEAVYELADQRARTFVEVRP